MHQRGRHDERYSARQHKRNDASCKTERPGARDTKQHGNCAGSSVSNKDERRRMHGPQNHGLRSRRNPEHGAQGKPRQQASDVRVMPGVKMMHDWFAKNDDDDPVKNGPSTVDDSESRRQMAPVPQIVMVMNARSVGQRKQ